ncbi:hypothetical protein C1645_732386 [Glomus cerebriforme]|uniref:Uncharacterized protein n=1 Tax=Glomus cerebriforme TaxID=658196 RepID=A0A397TI02_9GLOM|nr:hypothetical protein C1645_732386 [Glomus cerebriforme]
MVYNVKVKVKVKVKVRASFFIRQNRSELLRNPDQKGSLQMIRTSFFIHQNGGEFSRNPDQNRLGPVFSLARTKRCNKRFKKDDIIRVQGRFSIIETEVDGSKIKLIKMVASDVYVLNIDEEDLPKSSLSVVLVGIASDNSEINDDKITLNLNAREYIDN